MLKGKIVFILIFILFFSLLISSGSAYAKADSGIQPVVTDLVTGRKKTDVGDVTVWNTDEYLFVKYETDSEWKLTETHLSVTDDFYKIPQTRSGNPKVGRFEYAMRHNPAVSEYTYKVDLGAWDTDTVLFIAAHAVVQGSENSKKSETAWANGIEFPGNSWAMYLNYVVADVFSAPDLPDTAVILTEFTGSVSDVYWTMTISEVEGDFDLENMAYGGWCIERFVGMHNNMEYTVNVSSSYDSELPKQMEENDWNKINYVLNHKDGYTVSEIQLTIWYFLGEEENMTALAEEAELHGGDFWPTEGQVLGVLLDAGSETQLTLIEVEL
jgi:hypothetical protein